ncbi:ComEA family DNA-binding protein [Lawsonibacter celer]|uniref:ComEA family DNA-binding protein n=1 Tax=Lawsonibacter celer TaxID=2986526 RepID=UPI001FADBB75|nr:ComEA family DNA-binding protein [Lawsonibacter celer]
MMKISKLELLTLLLAAVFLAFTAGWFLGGSRQAEGVRVETQRTLRQAEPIGAPAPSPSEQTPAPTELININTADAQTLQQLPGIGEKRAQDIIDYRTEHGPFRIPEDLTKVDGIGEGTLQGLIDRITTGEEPQ